MSFQPCNTLAFRYDSIDAFKYSELQDSRVTPLAHSLLFDVNGQVLHCLIGHYRLHARLPWSVRSVCWHSGCPRPQILWQDVFYDFCFRASTEAVRLCQMVAGNTWTTRGARWKVCLLGSAKKEQLIFLLCYCLFDFWISLLINKNANICCSNK